MWFLVFIVAIPDAPASAPGSRSPLASLSIIACGLVPDAILIRLCEAIEASRYRTRCCIRDCCGAAGGAAHGDIAETPMYIYCSSPLSCERSARSGPQKSVVVLIKMKRTTPANRVRTFRILCWTIYETPLLRSSSRCRYVRRGLCPSAGAVSPCVR